MIKIIIKCITIVFWNSHFVISTLFLIKLLESALNSQPTQPVETLQWSVVNASPLNQYIITQEESLFNYIAANSDLFVRDYLEFWVCIEHNVFNGALDVFSPAGQPRNGVVMAYFLPAVTRRWYWDMGFSVRARKHISKHTSIQVVRVASN